MLKDYQNEFFKLANALHSSKQFLTRKEAIDLSNKIGRGLPHWYLTNYNIGRNQYSLDATIMPTTRPWGDTYRKVNIQSKVPIEQNVTDVAEVKTELQIKSLIPDKDPYYVPAGHLKELVKVLKSGFFMPIFTTGLSGMGKTKDVFEACANTKRELIRVNITVETDEDDLLGHFTLKDGETVWEDGPVIIAMVRGAVLLLDEVDLASNKIMCLQPILEGGNIFLKKINRLVVPAQGFTIVATANTKGKGSEDGRFIGANILNEAFLDRFPLTFEQEHPSMNVETKILTEIMIKNKLEDSAYVDHLVKWADIIRKTFFDGGIDEIISTRRLINIINCYAIFNDKLKAIQYSINRFDDDTKNSFMDLYTKVDDTINVPVIEENSSNQFKETLQEKTDKVMTTPQPNN